MDLTILTDAELTDLQSSLQAERKRRAAEPLVDEARTEMVRDLVTAGTITGAESADDDTPAEDIPAWVNPGTDHTLMYMQGAIATHDGKRWRSEHPFLNHWEPGTVGVDCRIWRDITPIPEPDPEEPVGPPAWDGQGHYYAVGDLVTYGDPALTYRVIQAHTSQAGWTPDAVPALYGVVVE